MSASAGHTGGPIDFVDLQIAGPPVVEGRLEMEVAGETVTVEPGDEVFIPKGALHSLRNVHHATSVWPYGYD